jgi:hypothetical protein
MSYTKFITLMAHITAKFGDRQCAQTATRQKIYL